MERSEPVAAEASQTPTPAPELETSAEQPVFNTVEEAPAPEVVAVLEPAQTEEVWVELDEPEPKPAKTRRPRGRGRGAKTDVVTDEAPIAEAVEQLDAQPVTEAPELAVAAPEPEPAPEPVVADVVTPFVEITPEPEPAPVQAPEPEPEPVVAAEPVIDPNEITAPPPAPKRGWWRGRG